MDKASYGTHTLRRTKATLIYRRTKNLRAVQLLLRHTKLKSTVRYLGIETRKNRYPDCGHSYALPVSRGCKARRAALYA